MTETRTTCPYCGVGCGVIACEEKGVVSVRGDDAHPANFGRLCVKGAALGETTGLSGRLLHPEVAGQRVSWQHAIDEAGGACGRLSMNTGHRRWRFMPPGNC